jgi:TP901 family phage tail tape measure protein
MPIQIPVTQTGLEASIQAAAQKAGRNLKIDLGSNARSINALSQPLGRITGQADEFTKSMEAANARVLAFGASVGVLNSVIQGFKSLVTTTIEVEKSLADINSVLQGSGAQLNKFKKDIFDVARETGNSFKTVSEAALELSRQGLPANEVVTRLKDSMILARLSGLDAAQSVEGLTAAVNSFSKEGLTSSQVLNKISNAAAKYAVSERDLIEGFKRSASVAQQAGVSIDELGGIITAVQQKSARGGAVIGNSFKTIFTRIQRPESLKLLEEIGVKVLDLKGNVVPATKLLEGLASKISGLNDVEVASITEKIGGGFQIAPLLSALDDYSSKASVARGATEAFLNAGTEAYQRNAALNQTMAAAINEASVNLKEFANTLGEIGVTKGLSNVLSFFNTFISDVQDLLEGEGLGSKFARSIVEGIGNVLSGPGLAIFGGIILKLTTDLVKFGTQSLKTFFNIGSAAKEINTLQGSIASTLLRNKDIQAQILALEGNRAAQARFFTTALNEQYSTMQKMQNIAASIAPAVYGGTVSSKKSSGKNAAGGYMPAISQESRDISRGVGGARGGDRPVVIPNFAFGGGKKGTMVAHTGEYIVPNFAGGGSAIFNRDMVRSMGLPAGAKKIGAAGGFIPNFAEWYNRDTTKVKTSTSMPTTAGDWIKVRSSSESIRKYSENVDQYKVRDTDFYLFPDGTGSRGNTVRDTLGRNKSRAVEKAEEEQEKVNKAGSFTLNADQLGGIGLISPRFGKSGVGSVDTKMTAGEVAFFNQNEKSFPIDKNKYIKLLGIKTANTPSGRSFQQLQGDVSELFAGGVVDLAYRLYGGTFDPASGGEFTQKLRALSPDKKQQLIPAAAQGDLFEAAGKVALGSIQNLESLFNQSDQNRPFDFNNRAAMQKMFGFDVGKGEAKRGGEGDSLAAFLGTKQVKGIITKVFNDPEYSPKALDALKAQGAFSIEMQRQKKEKEISNAISGFVPNFASYPYKLSTLAPTEKEGQRSYSKWEKWNQLSGEEKKNTPYKSKVINNPYAIKQFNQGLRLNPNVEKDDKVDSLGFRVTKVPIYDEKLKEEIINKKNSKEAGRRFEKLALEFLKYNDGSEFLYNRDKSSVDGFKFKGNKNIDLLEVKAGEWNASEVQNKFGRFVPENINLSGSSLIKEELNKLFTEGVPREQDVIKLNNTLAIPDIEGYSGKIKAGGKADPNKKQKDFYDAFSVSQLSQAQNAKLKKGSMGYIPNFVNQKYVMDTLARIKAGTSGFSKQEQETFLNKFGAKSTGRKISLREVYDKLDGDIGISALIDKAYVAAGPTASNEDVYRVFEKQIKANPYALRGLVSKKGFIPNFADPLKEAIGREISAGVPASQIYVDQNSSLKNSMNPMGLMVANRRDEPAGGIQGINRARKEGANPMLYGAADGFIPNYAPQLGEATRSDMGRTRISDQAITDFNNSLKGVSDQLRKGSISFADANLKVDQLAKSTGSTQAQVMKLGAVGQGLITAYNNELQARNQKAKELKEQRAGRSTETAGSKGSRDMLGTIFAVQAGLSLLTGATNDSTNALVRYTNVISNSLGNITTAAFAASAFKDMATTGKGLVGVFGKLGVAGAAVGAAFALFEGGKQLYYEYSGANKRASDAANILASSAEKAAVRLENLNPESKESINKTVEDIIKKLNIQVSEPELPKLKEAITTGLLGTSRTNVEGILRENLTPSKLQKKEIDTSEPSLMDALRAGAASSPGTMVPNVKYKYTTEEALTGDPLKAIAALAEQGVSGQGATLMGPFLSLVKEAKNAEELSSFLANPKLNEKINENLKNIDTKSLFDLTDINKTFEQVSILNNSKDFAKTFEAMEGKTSLVSSLKEQEASIAIIYEFVKLIQAAREETEKNATIETAKQEQALSRALQDSLKKSVLERPTKTMQQAGSLLESSLEISNKQKLLQITGDLSISEDLRKQKLEEVNHQYEISKIGLQNQLKLIKQLDSSLEKISSGDILGFGSNSEQAAKQAKAFIEKFTSDPNNQNALEGLLAGNKNQNFINQLRSQVQTGANLFNTPGKQDELIRIIKEYYELTQDITLEEKTQINNKQKLFEASQKELSIEKQRQNLIEKGNLYIKTAQSRLTGRIEDISNESQLNEARKNLEIKRFEKTGKTVDPRENERIIESINEKYFKLQQDLNDQKAEAEIKLEITRGLKIDDNITSLGANTTAIGSVQDALINNVLPVLNTLPKNMAEQLKNAVLGLNNGGQPVPQTAQTTSGVSGTIGMPYRANTSSGDVKSLLDLVSKEISSDPKYLAAVYGNVMKESGGKPITEASDYSNTDNKRIRSIFGDRVNWMTDEDLSELKKDPMFLGKMYGPKYQIGKNLGNKSEEEGFNYRGRGYVQITGRKAYEEAGKAIGKDLLRDPDLAAHPEIAKQIAVWQLRDRKDQFTGGGFNKLLLEGDQSKINKAVTSQFAGQSANRGYLGDLLKIVDNFADKFLKGSTDLGGSLDNTSKNFLQASGYLEETSSTAQTNIDNLRLELAGKDRNKAPNQDLQDKIRRIVAETYGPSAIATIYSGMGYTPGGSRRHEPQEGGKAADIYVEIDGKKVTGEELAKLGARWVTGGYGSAGYGMDYQGIKGSGIHLDTFTKDQLKSGEGLSWGYGGQTGSMLKNLISRMGGEPGVSASALANQTLSQTNPIYQAGERISGISDSTARTESALEEAKKLVDRTGKSDEEIKKKINEIANQIIAASDAIISKGKTKTTADALNQLSKQNTKLEAQPGTFASGFTTGMENINKEIAGFSEQIGEKVPALFADNMAKAMEDAILNGEDLETSLRSAATAFLTEINRSNFKNLANIFTSGLQQAGSSIFSLFTQRASGGPITGGSGTKDDVPALLMGGEFVMNKKSVSKYGMNFMNQLNNGNLPKFAKGGSVEEISDISKIGKQTIFSGKVGSEIVGQYDEGKAPRQVATGGGFYSPGMYGSGSIIGKADLLAFATQSQTSGAKDVIMNEDKLAYASLEPESARLTVSGRMNSPEFQAVQKDKEEAFNLYLQQLNQEQALKEKEKAEKKAFRKAWQTALWTTVASSVISAIAKPAMAGFQAGMGQAASQNLTGFQALGSGFKGIWSGGNFAGTQIGGLSNFFSGNNQLANIGTVSQLSSLYQSNPNSNLGKLLASNSSNYISGISIPKAIPVNRATGGLIPNTSGTDTTQAMLSGGEFIMNRAATQNIGVGALQSLNAGGRQNSTESADKIVSKLDELIAAIKENMSGNISVNVNSNAASEKETADSSSSGNNSESNNMLKKKIKAAVMEVIQQEKRLGGSLRFTQ